MKITSEQVALIKFLSEEDKLDPSKEITISKYGFGTYYSYGEAEYLILDDNSANRLTALAAEVKFELMLSKLDDMVARYIDKDKYVEDCKQDRGFCLAEVDGVEHKQTIKDTDYFIYRTN